MVEDYINNKQINIIIIFITNLNVEISIDKKDSISIYHYQFTKLGGLNKDNINNINKDIIIL